ARREGGGEAGKGRRGGLRRRMPDRGGGDARGVARAEPVHEQRREREKCQQRNEHDRPATPHAGGGFDPSLVGLAHGVSPLARWERRVIPRASTSSSMRARCRRSSTTHRISPATTATAAASPVPL